jgi:hypothetical protein
MAVPVASLGLWTSFRRRAVKERNVQTALLLVGSQGNKVSKNHFRGECTLTGS